MTPELNALEADLRDLQAAALDDALMLRLEAAAEGSWTELTHEEIRFENFLRDSAPAALPADFLARLEGVVAHTPFTVNEKIVLFPRSSAPSQPRRFNPIWRTAAAVALIGAAAAFMIPTGKPVQKMAAQSPASTVAPAISSPSGGNLVPASFNRGLSSVSDEGIVWKSNKQPHNVVRVSYEEKITLKDEIGRTYQVVQPRVQYMLVPAKTD